jgi:hypothetical protein
MPTVVHFIGEEKPITLGDEFDRVNAQLVGSEGGQFKTVGGASVTVYKSGIAYIEEARDPPEPMAASA